MQVDGLIGSRGILPAAEYLARARVVLGSGLATYWRLPTVFWLDASDSALHAMCWGGVAVSVALAAGLLPGFCTVFLWLSYLSIVVVGQVFLGYQWDSLLLETGLLAAILTPWAVSLRRAEDEPWRPTIWLVRWLWFRLMFLSGIVKLVSHDPAWAGWKALDYHYETQPLPVWTSWYVHQMPPWFHWLSVGFMFYAELVAPFFILGPRPIRLAGFASLVLLQLLIAATGNYGFFNLLAIVLCLSVLDDRDWRRLAMLIRHVREPSGSEASSELDPVRAPRPWTWWRKSVAGLLGGFIILVTAGASAERIWPGGIVTTELASLGEWIEPLRSTNTYGLFAVMTTTRPEIQIEGSDDGSSWKPYRFRWKPGEPDRGPRFATPHLPRLDWQLWFAALAGDCRSQPWFLRFEQRLLEGSPEVLALLRENPFPASPPRYVRARLYDYTFTPLGASDWWARRRGAVLPAAGHRGSRMKSTF